MLEEAEEQKRIHNKELELIYIASFENEKKQNESSINIRDIIKVSSGGKPSTRQLLRQDTPVKGYNDLEEVPFGLRLKDSVLS